MVMTIDISSIAFSAIYMIGHLIGTIIAGLIQILTGRVVLQDNMINTIGLLTMTTALLALADVAKKVAWAIVTICWALVIMRIGMLVIGNS